MKYNSISKFEDNLYIKDLTTMGLIDT